MTTPQPVSRTTSGLSLALAVVAALSALPSLLGDTVLRGNAAMNGSARGTALVVLTVGVPMLLLSVVAARRGSAVARMSWLGSIGFLTYNALLFLFATPANQFFLAYVAWLGLALWSGGTLLAETDAAGLAARFDPHAPNRGVAAYIWVVCGLNALAWLSRVVPAAGSAGTPSFLDGSGLLTNVVYVQDLALCLPLMAVIAWWLWHRRPWGFVLAVAGLVMWVVESVSIAVDQAYGAAADPGSSVVSAALTPVFATLAAVGLIPILWLLKGFDGGLRAQVLALAPQKRMAPLRVSSLAATALLLAAAGVDGAVGLIRDGYGMPDSWLDGTPFTTWTVPGLSLVVGVVLPQLVTLVLAIRQSRWTRVTGLLAGALLVAWIVVQLLVLQRFSFLQLVISAAGAVEMWLALGPRMARRTHPPATTPTTTTRSTPRPHGATGVREQGDRDGHHPLVPGSARR